MNMLTTDTLMGLLPSVLFYFAVGTLGAFTKNTYETMTKQIKKIRLGEVLIGGIVTTIICVGLSDTVFKNFSLNLMAFVTFVLGGLGFEIFGNMTSIDKVRNLLAIVNEVRKGVPPDQSGARSVSEFEQPKIEEEKPPEPEETEPIEPTIEVGNQGGAISITIRTDTPIRVQKFSPTDSDKDEGE